MSAETVWRHWRRQVHDILEVGGDAHPAAGQRLHRHPIVLNRRLR
jgi:hypothetical protein